MSGKWSELVRCAAGLAIALAGALLARYLSIPLPWMLGALLATAITKTAGLKTRTYTVFRYAGQWVIGVTLGLHFSPDVISVVGRNLPFIAAGMVFAVFLGATGAFFLQRLGPADFKTAWFASAIGGASEMSNLADRHGARVDLVASAHSLRMLMVVILIPVAFELLGFEGQAPDTANVTKSLNPAGLALLLALTVSVALAFKKLRTPNAWVLGPLCITAALTSQNMIFTELPSWVSPMGQLLIGWSLGDRFGPDFFRRAPRYLAATGLVNMLNLTLAFGFGYVLSLISSIPFPTLVLGTSPGGITEMAITAKVLMLGAPIVTSFHVLRMVFVLLVTGPLYRVMERIRSTRQA